MFIARQTLFIGRLVGPFGQLFIVMEESKETEKNRIRGRLLREIEILKTITSLLGSFPFSIVEDLYSINEALGLVAFRCRFCVSERWWSVLVVVPEELYPLAPPSLFLAQDGDPESVRPISIAKEYTPMFTFAALLSNLALDISEGREHV